MRELLDQLDAALSAGRQVAYCRLVETRGSTPQKAGALMLVFADGTQAGTLGGGCVEAEVKRRALAILADGRPEVCRFQLDSDYGWDDGLICGGRMNILIQPFVAGPLAEYYARLRTIAAGDEGCTEAIVFESQGDHPAAPTSLLYGAADNLLAQYPAGAATPAQVAAIADTIEPLENRPRAYASHGVAYLPLLPRCRLIIVGGGHVGLAVANLAYDLDFDVWVVDDREEYVSDQRFPRAQRRIAGPVPETLRALEITPNTYCLIVTRGHNHDEEALFHLIDRGARYVGLIGSKRKIKLIFDDLLAEGVSPAAIAQVFAPLGIEIGSQTVAEIAVSIAAELVSHRNRGGVVPGRPEPIFDAHSH